LTKAIAMRDAFLRKIHKEMDYDRKIFFVSADFGSPVLDEIRRDYPERFINVGIAEQNLINISAGLSLEGFKVFAYAIAPFITMRCFEQLRVNLALLSEVRELNVNLVGVGAGYSYVVSGPTHQCYEDLSLIRSLPNFKILSPSDHYSAEGVFQYCLDNKGPKYLRFDAQLLPALRNDVNKELISNGFEVLQNDGSDGIIIATGYMVHTALKVASYLREKGKFISVIDLVNLTGFDPKSLLKEIQGFPLIVTLEEGFEGRGGLDALIGSFVNKEGLKVKLEGIGVRPGYSFELGTRQQLHEKVGIGERAVSTRIIKSFKELELRVHR